MVDRWLWTQWIGNLFQKYITQFTKRKKNICPVGFDLEYCCGLQIRRVEEQLKQRVIGKTLLY